MDRVNKLVICISGKMRSGKNQFAEYLAEAIKSRNCGTVEYDMFAGDLKQNAFEDFQRLIKVFKEEYDRVNRDIGDPKILGLEWLNVKKEHFFEDKTILTRALLQIYGTDIFCNRVDSNYWAQRVQNRAVNSNKNFILITDTRFENELEMLSDLRNYITVAIRIERDTGIQCDHPSEVSLDKYPFFDFTVENNSDLESLKQSAEAVLDKILEEYFE